MIREIQGKIRARFEDSKKIPRAVDVIRNRVGPPDYPPLFKSISQISLHRGGKRLLPTQMFSGNDPA